MPEKRAQFRQALDGHHQWPCPYVFKFIMPTENLPQFTALFPDESTQNRSSKTGKYTSVTMSSTMCSAEEVMAVYDKAAQIPGIMSL